MGKSFYVGAKLADLQAKSQAFSDLIESGYASYGITQAMAQSYKTLNDNFSAAYFLAKAEETRTKGTVQARRDVQVLLIAKASELAKIIEANPAVTNQQRIDLGLSVRATPGPVGELGQSRDFKATLSVNGSLGLKWKNTNPTSASGVVYQIFRRTSASGEFTYLGGVGEKKFTDSTIPAGSSEITYQIQAVRSTSVGPWAEFTVRLGAPGAASVTETTPAAEIAA